MQGTIEVSKSELHNLKSTLTAVMGYVQMAQSKAEACDQEEAKAINAMLLKALETANVLIKNIQKLEGINEPLMDL